MIPTTNAPSAVAYFNVFVPLSSAGSEEDAQRVVNNYLYSGFMSLPAKRGSLFDDGDEATHWVVPVRYADYNHVSRVRSNLQYQRDRFSSGLYASSEPIVYLPVP